MPSGNSGDGEASSGPAGVARPAAASAEAMARVKRKIWNGAVGASV